MRIDVVGLPASGKSTFAAKVSHKLSIPHIQLDTFWFESGGKQGRFDTPNLEEVQAKVRKRVLEAATTQSWVSDGFYLHVQDMLAKQADVIIFLDIPLWMRLLNHAKRAFFESKRHTHLTLWDELTFFREIIRRNYSSKPKHIAFLKDNAGKVVTLRSKKEADEYIQSLPTT